MLYRNGICHNDSACRNSARQQSCMPAIALLTGHTVAAVSWSFSTELHIYITTDNSAYMSKACSAQCQPAQLMSSQDSRFILVDPICLALS